MTQSDSTPIARVEPGAFLTLHYRLSGPHGDVVNTFGQAPATLSLGNHELSPALEDAMLGLPEGAHEHFTFEPGVVFGQRNPDLLQWASKASLAAAGENVAELQVGEVVQVPSGPNGQHVAGIIRQVQDDALLLDFNHPLAGSPVNFEVQIIGVL
jgi:FKBP-type peptidyl-prolyl cis-trans isomerase SlpA